MKKFLHHFSPREWTLVGLTLLVGIIVPLYLFLLLPQWRRLDQARMETAYLEAELAELQNNLRVRDQVYQLYGQSRVEPLPPEKSDHIITSDLLREIDAIRANYPSLVVGNIRPLPPETPSGEPGARRTTANQRASRTSQASAVQGGGAKAFPVRLTVSGKLPEVVDFVTSLAHRRVLIRLDSFTLRGMQGVNQVECKLEIRMVGFEEGGL